MCKERMAIGAHTGSAGVATVVKPWRGIEVHEKREEQTEQLLRVEERGSARRGWYQFLQFGEKKVEFLVDTAADASIVSERTARTICKDIWRTKRVFRSFGGIRVPIVGEFDGLVKYKGRFWTCNFVVASGDSPNVLGLRDLKRLGVFNKN
jgi:hypothetical protein